MPQTKEQTEAKFQQRLAQYSDKSHPWYREAEEHHGLLSPVDLARCAAIDRFYNDYKPSTTNLPPHWLETLGQKEALVRVYVHGIFNKNDPNAKKLLDEKTALFKKELGTCPPEIENSPALIEQYFYNVMVARLGCDPKPKP